GADGFVGSMELVSICELCAKLVSKDLKEIHQTLFDLKTQFSDIPDEPFSDLHEDFSAYLLESRLSFDFVESSLITALKEGNWVILENIHAASSDVIEQG
ncbi:hypothetical protein ADUPG1_003740, partial [Aduncisulcus paluster]